MMAQKRFAAPLKCAHIAEYEVNSRTDIYTFQSKWLMKMQQEPVAVPRWRRGGTQAPPNRGWSSRMLHEHITTGNKKVKVKFFPYSLPSVGPGADPGVQAVSPQVT